MCPTLRQTKEESIMKSLICITRNLEESEESIDRDYTACGEKAVVGPFNSQNDASEWLQFMLTRTANAEEVDLSESSSEDNLWYGIVLDPK